MIKMKLKSFISIAISCCYQYKASGNVGVFAIARPIGRAVIVGAITDNTGCVNFTPDVKENACKSGTVPVGLDCGSVAQFLLC